MFDLWVGGLVADRGKLIDEAEWSLAVPLDLLDDVPMGIYQHGVAMANQAAQSVRRAVKAYAVELKVEKEKAQGLRQQALTYFWSRLDQQYELLIELAEGTKRLEPWTKLLRQVMHEAYEIACPHTTPRQIEAYVTGRRQLALHEKPAETPAAEEVSS